MALKLYDVEGGVFGFYKLLRDGPPNGKEAFVVGSNMSASELKDLTNLIKETIENGDRLYLPLRSDQDIRVYIFFEGEPE